MFLLYLAVCVYVVFCLSNKVDASDHINYVHLML